MGPRSANRALLYQEPDHGAVREPHLSGRERVWRRSRRRNLFWQAGKRPDVGRSCAAGRRAESAGRILSDFKSSQGERAPRSGARPDGQDWICFPV